MTAKILAIDTSSEACSVALSTGAGDLFRHTDEPRKHAELVLPMVDALLAEAGVALSDLDAIAFGRGPGAFTGLRIAAGMVQGLAFGAGLPVVSVSSLAVLAHRTWREMGWTQCHAAFDARMGEVYWGSYRISGAGSVELVGRECVCKPEEVASHGAIQAESSWNGAGSGWCYQKLLELGTGPLQHCQPSLLPHGLDLLALAQTGFAAGELIPAEQVVPVYLRNNVAVKSTKHS
ncbi:tRNA (adenosine(37)-N6)-threonylcarbamoyltransferase complex dimerization subunit type 1 TsaB [Ketobacter alkanivorans]|uniref:tRNA threonylcarbamoyladenosine biosynthesis protein TsaB n=1 Tax=Ketobacter alkanivorans TaxID=1917421 RepID=A0A2K9LH60_9GAMM|nr:tRNA (adenosine(37)-N6)-threonylcarbamoyltransferase complex dimerization subunit type 1 TsaB [Ketobacter alkanivorans]AUM11708.1 tRNA (adenosine(37)-N6)-threonylcarbamoyltransferase complex dimerization subunit type 1 TsaB [Ketobacter alkanivorans]MCP5015209.1 tRNA (adenosine(37)-N6)-threonylcarbamoyltransferase complex dimerization subunit type 1 TsaB [Ketobacter sp.]